MKSFKFFALALVCALIQTTAFSQNQNAGKVVTDYFNWVDAGNLDAVGTLLKDDFTATAPLSPVPFNKMAWRGVGQTLNTAFPDMKHEILNWVVSGNKVAAQGILRGTNTGPYLDNPATGNKINCPFNAIFELDAAGKIKSLNTQFDLKTFEAQLMAGLPDPKKQAEKSIRELFVLMDAGQVEKFDRYCSADFRISNPFLPGPSPIGAFQGVLQAQKTAFPDMKHEVIEVITDGKTVTTRGVFRGTNTGSMMGNPPTGNTVNLPFLVLDELDGMGKIKNRFVQFDSKSFEAQLAGTQNISAKAAAESMMAELNKGNLDGVLAHCAADARFHGWGPQPLDAAGYRQAMSEILAAFPDARFTVQDIVADGGKVAVRHQLEGTHTGTTFQGIAKTNRKVAVPATVTFHIQNGKAAELWLNADMLGLLMQLGANPMAGGK